MKSRSFWLKFIMNFWRNSSATPLLASKLYSNSFLFLISLSRSISWVNWIITLTTLWKFRSMLLFVIYTVACSTNRPIVPSLLVIWTMRRSFSYSLMLCSSFRWWSAISWRRWWSTKNLISDRNLLTKGILQNFWLTWPSFSYKLCTNLSPSSTIYSKRSVNS